MQVQAVPVPVVLLSQGPLLVRLLQGQEGPESGLWGHMAQAELQKLPMTAPKAPAGAAGAPMPGAAAESPCPGGAAGSIPTRERTPAGCGAGARVETSCCILRAAICKLYLIIGPGFDLEQRQCIPRTVSTAALGRSAPCLLGCDCVFVVCFLTVLLPGSLFDSAGPVSVFFFYTFPGAEGRRFVGRRPPINRTAATF